MVGLESLKANIMSFVSGIRTYFQSDKTKKTESRITNIGMAKAG